MYTQIGTPFTNNKAHNKLIHVKQTHSGSPIVYVLKSEPPLKPQSHRCLKFPLCQSPQVLRQFQSCYSTFFQLKHKYQEKMSSAVFELLSRDNVVFRAYAFWASVLLLKTLAMSMLTAMQRFRTKVSWRRMWICGRSRMCIRIATTLDIDFGLALLHTLTNQS